MIKKMKVRILTTNGNHTIQINLKDFIKKIVGRKRSNNRSEQKDKVQ